MNSLIGSIFIGFLQGVLEWLPVSSEGNLVIILVGLFGFEVDSTISTVIFLHIGTGFSALVYFRLEVIDILVGRTDETRSLRLKLFVITLITGLVGFPIYLWLDVSTVYSELLLVVTGLALITTGLLQREAGKREEGGVDLSWPLSTLLGVAQGLAIMPGLSRSGLTTSIMLLNKYTSENAFRLSFLMSIPASFAAAAGCQSDWDEASR